MSPVASIAKETSFVTSPAAPVHALPGVLPPASGGRSGLLVLLGGCGVGMKATEGAVLRACRRCLMYVGVVVLHDGKNPYSYKESHLRSSS